MALALDGAGEARTSDLVEHTAELGGASELGAISSFGVDSDGELFVVSHSKGSVFRILGPSRAPPAPTGLRIVP